MQQSWFKRAWRNYLDSGFEVKTDVTLAQLRRIRFINAFSLFGIVSTVGFGTLNVLALDRLLGVIEVALGLVAIGNLIALRRTKRIAFSGGVILGIMVLMLSVLFLRGGIGNTGAFWFFTFPLLAFFLTSTWVAAIWHIALLGSIASILIGNVAGLLSTPYTPQQTIQLLVSLAVVAGLAGFYARINEADRRALEASQERMRRTSEQLREAQRIAQVGSWEWDIAKDTISWSEELYRIYGTTPKAFDRTYRGFLALIHPSDRDRVDKLVRRSFETGLPFEFDHRLTLPDGSERIVHARGDVIRDPDGKPVKMVGTGQDVTKLKQADEGLKRRSAELEEMNKVLVGREMKMNQLKEENQRLKAALASKGGGS